MQLAGDRFTNMSALLGNDLATFPDFPAEIRAPAGTLAGVSAFQVHISDHDILTPGDSPNVLVAMNPAALSANLSGLPKGATVIVNVDAFDERNLKKAGYDTNPLGDGTLAAYTVYEVPMTSITTEVSKEAGVQPRDAERSKNFFALGLISWLYTRPIEATIDWIQQKLRGQASGHGGQPAGLQGRLPLRGDRRAVRVLLRGAAGGTGAGRVCQHHRQYRHGLGPHRGRHPERSEALPRYPTHHPGVLTSCTSSPSSKQFGVRTFQAEDEISGIGAALGAAFGGGLGVTTTSGPGIDLKSETMGLAISLELPLLIIDIQRGGLSTGLPTKTEQADLLHAMYGRHGEAPLPIVAAKTPAHCFEATWRPCAWRSSTGLR